MYWKMSKHLQMKNIYSLAKSFTYAFRGLRFAIDNERNMRIHLSVAVFVLEFSVIYGLKPQEYAILLIVFGLVIAAEMINTAIEALVDLSTPGYDSLAKIAKDVAAGAVLILAVISVIVGGILFFRPRKLEQSFLFLWEHPLLLVIGGLELILAILFIFRWNSRNLIGHKRK